MMLIYSSVPLIVSIVKVRRHVPVFITHDILVGDGHLHILRGRRAHCTILFRRTGALYCWRTIGFLRRVLARRSLAFKA